MCLPDGVRHALHPALRYPTTPRVREQCQTRPATCHRRRSTPQVRGYRRVVRPWRLRRCWLTPYWDSVAAVAPDPLAVRSAGGRTLARAPGPVDGTRQHHSVAPNTLQMRSVDSHAGGWRHDRGVRGRTGERTMAASSLHGIGMRSACRSLGGCIDAARAAGENDGAGPIPPGRTVGGGFVTWVAKSCERCLPSDSTVVQRWCTTMWPLVPDDQPHGMRAPIRLAQAGHEHIGVRAGRRTPYTLATASAENRPPPRAIVQLANGERRSNDLVASSLPIRSCSVSLLLLCGVPRSLLALRLPQGQDVPRDRSHIHVPVMAQLLQCSHRGIGVARLCIA